jgi:DNA-directed RNA polymerase subunit H
LNSEEIDITKHELVPKHRIVSPEEKEEIKKKYRVKSDSQFPRILKKDPVMKAIGANKGDLIEITKKGPIGETIYYRIVVE